MTRSWVCPTWVQPAASWQVPAKRGSPDRREALAVPPCGAVSWGRPQQDRYYKLTHRKPLKIKLSAYVTLARCETAASDHAGRHQPPPEARRPGACGAWDADQRWLTIYGSRYPVSLTAKSPSGVPSQAKRMSMACLGRRGRASVRASPLPGLVSRCHPLRATPSGLETAYGAPAASAGVSSKNPSASMVPGDVHDTREGYPSQHAIQIQQRKRPVQSDLLLGMAGSRNPRRTQSINEVRSRAPRWTRGFGGRHIWPTARNETMPTEHCGCSGVNFSEAHSKNVIFRGARWTEYPFHASALALHSQTSAASGASHPTSALQAPQIRPPFYPSSTIHTLLQRRPCPLGCVRGTRAYVSDSRNCPLRSPRLGRLQNSESASRASGYPSVRRAICDVDGLSNCRTGPATYKGSRRASTMPTSFCVEGCTLRNRAPLS